MNNAVKEDLYRYEGARTNALTLVRYVLFTPGFRYVFFWRHASMAKNIVSKIFYNVMLRICMETSGIQIPPSTKIGRGFRIVHFGNIVINPEAVIGHNFNISQGALIGNAQGKRGGVPIIGNNVCVNANATIVGGCKIGDNVLIAPGAFVNFDVPSDSIVIGNPGKIIPSNRPTGKYIVYPLTVETI